MVFGQLVMPVQCCAEARRRRVPQHSTAQAWPTGQILSPAPFRWTPRQKMQPLSHETICAKTNPWKNHMRDTICAKTKFQASRCKNAVLSKKRLQMNQEILIWHWTVEHFPKYNFRTHWKSLEGWHFLNSNIRKLQYFRSFLGRTLPKSSNRCYILQNRC